jgi:hypothetical protein
MRQVFTLNTGALVEFRVSDFGMQFADQYKAARLDS